MTVQRCLYSLCALAGQGFFISCIIYSLLHWSTKSVRIANTKEKKKGKREAWMTKFRSKIKPRLQLPQCIGCALWPLSSYKKDSLNHKDQLAIWAKMSSPLNFRKKSNLGCPVTWKGPSPGLGFSTAGLSLDIFICWEMVAFGNFDTCFSHKLRHQGISEHHQVCLLIQATSWPFSIDGSISRYPALLHSGNMLFPKQNLCTLLQQGTETQTEDESKSESTKTRQNA